MTPNPDGRKCLGCGEFKGSSEFHKSNRTPCGLATRCKACGAESIRQRSRRYQARHAESRSQRLKESRAANPQRFRAYYERKYVKERGNHSLRIARAIGCRLRHALKGGKAGRSWREYVDYSLDELTAHLERQFLKGMSWDNYGDWHVDHIIPVASFTITGPNDPELRRAWALPNLRPLWAIDNLRKSAKVETLL
jgi:hypothetical protein